MTPSLRCKPGDTAVVIQAFNKENLGLIVKVLSTYANQDELTAPPGSHLWEVSSTAPLVYECQDGRFVQTNVGPVPDYCLRPLNRWHDRFQLHLTSRSLGLFEMTEKIESQPTVRAEP